MQNERLLAATRSQYMLMIHSTQSFIAPGWVATVVALIWWQDSKNAYTFLNISNSFLSSYHILFDLLSRVVLLMMQDMSVYIVRPTKKKKEQWQWHLQILGCKQNACLYSFLSRRQKVRICKQPKPHCRPVQSVFVCSTIASSILL